MDVLDRAQDIETRERDAVIAKARYVPRRACTTGERIYCADCGEDIPEARRRALPGAELCTFCQSEAERG